MNGMTIVSTGRYIPQTVVSNDDMAKIVETNDEWISTRTGIKTRCMAGGGAHLLHGRRGVEACARGI